MESTKHSIKERIQAIRHVALDMDGTLYLGSRLFPQTLPFLEELQKQGIGFTYLTNNSSKSREEYYQKLQKMGLPGEKEQILTSTHATVAYLRKKFPEARRLFVLGTPAMQSELGSLGYFTTEEDPELVIVGFDMTLSYERLCRAAWWIAQGKPFIASHPDLICPTDQPTIFVDCGAICKALEAATGIAPIIVGKPDPRMLDPIYTQHGVEKYQVAMVGDRLMTDIAMARASGVLGVLVLTGEAQKEDLSNCSEDQKPDLVLNDIGELGTLFSKRG